MSDEIKGIVQRLRGSTVLDVELHTESIEWAVKKSVAATIAIQSALTGRLGFPSIYSVGQVQQMIAEVRHKLDMKSQRYMRRHHETKGYLAKQWLLELFSDGKQRKVADIERLADEAGHNWVSIFRAKQALQIVSVKPNLIDGWIWLPPLAAPLSKPSKAEA